MSAQLFTWAEQVRQNNAVYGIRWSVDNQDPNGLRTGNAALHRTNPIQSKMRRCVQLDSGAVNYYLHPTDSTLKEDGSAANLTGADGQWMAEVPAHWTKSVHSALWEDWSFSLIRQTGAGWEYVPKHYVSAGQATIQRSTSKLSCVVSTAADYRGGDNSATNDANEKTFLGRPASVFSRTSGRTYAANRGTGWVMDVPVTYNAWRRLMFCEYGTRNIQLAFNATLTARGYRQGGLGPGVTEASGTEWNNFNGYYPFIPIGATTSLGSASGIVSVVVTNFGGAGVNRTFSVPSYRGIEHPWGHIWTWIDGYNIWAQTVAEGSKTLLYAKKGITGLADGTATGYTLVGELPRSPNYMRNSLKGHLFPSAAGGTGAGSTTFYCDYFYTDATTSFGWRAPIVGGYADNGAGAGPVYVNSGCAASAAGAYIGSRLCFLGA